jgi:hypothetical protein
VKEKKKKKLRKKRHTHLEDVSQPVLDLVHDLDERRVEVAEQREGLRREHARVGVGRAGAHQQAGRDLSEERERCFFFSRSSFS